MRVNSPRWVYPTRCSSHIRTRNVLGVSVLLGSRWDVGDISLCSVLRVRRMVNVAGRLAHARIVTCILVVWRAAQSVPCGNV